MLMERFPSAVVHIAFPFGEIHKGAGLSLEDLAAELHKPYSTKIKSSNRSQHERWMSDLNRVYGDRNEGGE